MIVADKSITIKNHENGEIFLRCSDERITKSYLTHMLASSGPWQNSGNLHIEKLKGWFKLENYETKVLTPICHTSESLRSVISGKIFEFFISVDVIRE